MPEMLEEVSLYDQEILFVVGFAGAGKSTELVNRANDSTLILTPTHKAADVLMGKGIQNVYTIYSTLKLVPTINMDYDPTKKQRMQRLSRIGNTKLEDITDVFIDEFSMIPDKVLDMLLEVLPAHAKVTIFGDPYQLPPVDGEPIEPYNYTDNVEELTKQYRAEAPEVVETFMRFMYYIKDGSEMNLKMNPKIKSGTIKEFNKETDRILAYTNARVNELNSEVADMLGLPAEYSIGEDLLANQIKCEFSDNPADTFIYPTCISKGYLMKGQDLQLAIMQTERDSDKFNTKKHVKHFPTCTIQIREQDYNIIYDPDHYHTQLRLKREVEERQAYLYSTYDIPEDVRLSTWCKEHVGVPGVAERSKAWSRQIAHNNLVFNLQRPFATTIHKSQGSEFSTVFIDQEDIKKSIRKGYYGQYARLMYVALSRAIKRVILI